MPYTVQIECLDHDGRATTHPILREAASEEEARTIMLAVIEDAQRMPHPVIVCAFDPASGLIVSYSSDPRVSARTG